MKAFKDAVPFADHKAPYLDMLKAFYAARSKDPEMYFGDDVSLETVEVQITSDDALKLFPGCHMANLEGGVQLNAMVLAVSAYEGMLGVAFMCGESHIWMDPDNSQEYAEGSDDGKSHPELTVQRWQYMLTCLKAMGKAI